MHKCEWALMRKNGKSSKKEAKKTGLNNEWSYAYFLKVGGEEAVEDS